jgi:hypothetical protein
MHILVGLVIVIGLVGFAFGADAARNVVRAVFALIVLTVLAGVTYAIFDEWRGAQYEAAAARTAAEQAELNKAPDPLRLPAVVPLPADVIPVSAICEREAEMTAALVPVENYPNTEPRAEFVRRYFSECLRVRERESTVSNAVRTPERSPLPRARPKSKTSTAEQLNKAAQEEFEVALTRTCMARHNWDRDAQTGCVAVAAKEFDAARAECYDAATKCFTAATKELNAALAAAEQEGLNAPDPLRLPAVIEVPTDRPAASRTPAPKTAGPAPKPTTMAKIPEDTPELRRTCAEYLRNPDDAPRMCFAVLDAMEHERAARKASRK